MAKAAKQNLELLEASGRLVDTNTIRERYTEKLVRVQQILSRTKGMTKEQQHQILGEIADA